MALLTPGGSAPALGATPLMTKRGEVTGITKKSGAGDTRGSVMIVLRFMVVTLSSWMGALPSRVPAATSAQYPAEPLKGST
jgi:hypothetical protein